MALSDLTFAYTAYRSLYDIDACVPVEESWSDLCARFSTHQVFEKKERAPGFGPYRLRVPHIPCSKHKDYVVREGPHRCDESVLESQLLVFDVDTGGTALVEGVKERIKAAGLAQHWYTTWSWFPKPLTEFHPSTWRLIIPLTSPVPARDLPELRLAVLERFKLPADPKKCSGRSHFYFVPAHPPDRSGQAETFAGEALNPVGLFKPKPWEVEVPYTYTPVAMPEGPVDLTPYKTTLGAAIARWSRSGVHRKKAELLSAVLEGKRLADPGSRNDTVTRVAGMIAWLLGVETPLGVLMAIIRPSLLAMQAEGSRVTETDVEGMYLRSLKGLAAQKAQDEALRSWLEGNYRKAWGLPGVQP